MTADSLPLSAVVMAAGRGARMRSGRPKPLHDLCGRAMLLHVLDALVALDPRRVAVVVGYGAEDVTKHVTQEALDLRIDFVEQPVQRGTADAAALGLTALDSDVDDEDVLVLSADMPLIRGGTLRGLVAQHRVSGSAATVATGDEHSAGIYCFRRSLLSPALRRVNAGDSGREHDLGDAVSVLTSAGHPAGCHSIDGVEAQGVDDREQLAFAEAEMRQRINRNWMVSGVRIMASHSAYIDVSVELAPDVVIHPGVVLRGRTMVGEGAIIGPHTHLVDCVVGPRAVVEAVSATDAEIGADARVGAYITLEPGARIPPASTGGS
ncbi:NTP transferase domain-containing protein [Candidatus Poriferisocius sp.]|uniref:NTP transferase domain-containing protein n=1 Tax=Candidatus Poriferisocius sp. TaxID=3101276 RepID=UPI003B02846F